MSEISFWDCKYYEVLDFYQGGFVAECSKKNVQMSDEEDICKDCEFKEKKVLEEGVFDCLDLENGVAYHDCSECDMECESRNYFEKVKE